MISRHVGIVLLEMCGPRPRSQCSGPRSVQLTGHLFGIMLCCHVMSDSQSFHSAPCLANTATELATLPRDPVLAPAGPNEPATPVFYEPGTMAED